jgi:heavy metal sensor kinase
VIRTRLTLWNSVVFAVALVLIGGIVYATTYEQLYRSIDQDLSKRSEGLERDWANHRFRWRPDQGPHPRGPHPGGPDSDGPHQDGPHPGEPHQGEPHQGGPRDERDFPPESGPNGPPPEQTAPGQTRLGDDDRGQRRSVLTAGPQPTVSESTSYTMPKQFITSLRTLDPIQARRLEFSARVTRPRIFRSDGAMMGPPDEVPFEPRALNQSFQGTVVMDTIEMDGHRLRVRSVPLETDGKITGAAQFASDLAGTEEVMARLRTTLFAIVPIALLATSLLGTWLTGRALRPVKNIADTAEAIEATNLANRLPVHGNDEFAYLSTRFNRMIERIERSFAALAEVNEIQRRFISDASHELKTPLTVIKGRAGLALSSTQSAERYQEHLRAIDRAADGMTNIVRDLLLLAQADENKLVLNRSSVPAGQLVADAIATLPDKGCLEIRIPKDLQMKADPELVKRALTNLISNAIRYNDKGLPIVISAVEQGEGVEVKVADQGEGIPPEHLASMFDRFHRVDASRDRNSGGTGLGLAIVKSIVEAHRGKVDLKSDLGQGTTVSLYFPNA